MSMIGRLTLMDVETLGNLVDDPHRAVDLLFPDEDDSASALDIDKSWHALHFALTGTAWAGDWPRSFLIEGGTVVGIEEDWGYGPPRAFTPTEVRQIADSVSSLSPEDLRARLDVHAMTQLEIYPHGWTAETELGYFVEHFERMQAFLRSAAAREMALVVSIS